LYSHSGTLDVFERDLKGFKSDFSENSVFPIIPFQIPTTSINYNFASAEIDYYIDSVKNLIDTYSEINFGLSIRYFKYSNLLDKYTKLISDSENIKILNLVDVFDSFSDFRNIIEIIIKIKSELDNNLVLMASGRIIPQHYPILSYLGIDLIDTSYLLYISAENLYNTIEYLLPLHKLKYPTCNCLACKGNLKNICEKRQSPKDLDSLTFHNLNSARDYMNKIKQYQHSEDFRAFLEKSSLDDTYTISLLKVLDKNHFNSIKHHSKLIQKNKKIVCLGPSSYHRPDFEEYRRRVLNRFTPEEFTKIIILLPCSAKKPYSESQSHKRFNNIMKSFSEYPSFQEFILTSPLGVIPRQLENIYPVNSYDISVTGDWSQEEIEISGNMLLEFLNKYNDDIPIICHLGGGYTEILDYVVEKTNKRFFYSEIKEKVTNRDALNSFKDVIESQINKESNFNQSVPTNENFTKMWYRKFIKILDYQFSKGIGLKLMEKCNNLKKNYRHSFIELFESKNKNKLGTFKFSNGILSLTLNGAQKVAFEPEFSNYMVFDGDDLRGNTLFRPGVREFNENLLPDDQVVIFNSNKKKILAVGKMVVGAKSIKNLKSGRVAKINESR
ncbi:MAG: hypothetical protein EU550_01400, partial [Promethearchaeota archaeon]